MMHNGLTTLSAPHVYLYCHAVDMRRSFNGLMAIVQAELRRDVRDGELFVFINRRADRLKAMWWDGDGLAIFMKTHATEHPRFKVFTEVARTNSFSVFAASACDMDR